MKIEEHYDKAVRLEKTIAKLDFTDDCETVILNCMFAGTHLVNCLLHFFEVHDTDTDIVHSDLTRIDRENYSLVLPEWDKKKLPSEVVETLKLLRSIEDLRPLYIRGKEVNSMAAKKSLAAYERIKDYANIVMQANKER